MPTTRFGNPILSGILRDMEKQRADATKAQAKAQRALPDYTRDLRDLLPLAAALQPSLEEWATDAFITATARAHLQGDPYWPNSGPGRAQDLHSVTRSQYPARNPFASRKPSR